MSINKEIPAQFIFPEDNRKLNGIRIENNDLNLLEMTEIAFFALDFGYKLSIASKDDIVHIYSPEALKNNLNNSYRRDRRAKVLEEMRQACFIILTDPSIIPSITSS